ncbi:MAG: valine--tRNA ligase [Flavobacteriales bacterium]|nr:valine--tRNA ligase [Flavobacteriales bacterium]
MWNEIPQHYDPTIVEDLWTKRWLDSGAFRSTPDEREPYTVVIPPPNVTGVLHMGHMLNNTIQDVLVRRARMQGKNACWVPGTDHASIATEAKVVRKLREQGIKKSDLSREDFLKHAWDWTHEHGGIILEQLKKLGASCDWERTRFTLDEQYSRSVIDTFIDLHAKGHIYRGKRMVNWDPVALTAVSDEEVLHTEEVSALHYVRYQVFTAGGEATDDWLTIATTRPETILADSAICVHPDDKRFTALHGQRARVPLTDRDIPIILDEYVDMEFGTGCLKVTPAHDTNDNELGVKHSLETIDMLNADATLNAVGGAFEGLDRFEARKAITAELDKTGHLIKVEQHPNKVGRSERTGAVIEPRLSMQWFVSMAELAGPALDHVMDGTIQFHPSKFKNSYRHWMENIKDWCISRQLWWGHRIPAWYYEKQANDSAGSNPDDAPFVIALDAQQAAVLASEQAGRPIRPEDLRQDEDVLDTWFSSWLWPISVFDGFYSEEEVDYYYPTNDLVTAPEIMFFWVARMIVAGYEYRGEAPFKNVYFTGIVRDEKGRKMSKSLGNSPDPIELMKKFGADGVRVGMLLTSPAGNDLPFDEALCAQGRNFSNKIWNAFRLVHGWEVAHDMAQPACAAKGIAWFEARSAQVLTEVEHAFDEFRLSEALMLIYKHIWDDFCSVYLELAKPPFGEPIDAATLASTTAIFERMLSMLHPFMPFLSEEVYARLAKRAKGTLLSCSAWPANKSLNEAELASNTQLLKDFDLTMRIVAEVRGIRQKGQIANKHALELHVMADSSQSHPSGKPYPAALEPVVMHLCNVSKVEHVQQKPSTAFGFVLETHEFFVPASDTVDLEAEREKIQKDLEYQEGFVVIIGKKLGNERFVAGAPVAVVEAERSKLAAAEAKIEVLQAKLQSLS